MVILLVQVNSFANKRFMIPTIALEIISSIYFLSFSFSTTKDWQSLLLQSLFGQVSLLIVLIYQYRTYQQVLSGTKEVLSLRDQFKSIFSNLGDASIIFSQKDVEIVNNQFLALFEQEIQKSELEKIDVHEFP